MNNCKPTFAPPCVFSREAMTVFCCCPRQLLGEEYIAPDNEINRERDMKCGKWIEIVPRIYFRSLDQTIPEISN